MLTRTQTVATLSSCVNPLLLPKTVSLPEYQHLVSLLRESKRRLVSFSGGDRQVRHAALCRRVESDLHEGFVAASISGFKLSILRLADEYVALAVPTVPLTAQLIDFVCLTVSAVKKAIEKTHPELRKFIVSRPYVFRLVGERRPADDHYYALLHDAWRRTLGVLGTEWEDNPPTGESVACLCEAAFTLDRLEVEHLFNQAVAVPEVQDVDEAQRQYDHVVAGAVEAYRRHTALEVQCSRLHRQVFSYPTECFEESGECFLQGLAELLEEATATTLFASALFKNKPSSGVETATCYLSLSREFWQWRLQYEFDNLDFDQDARDLILWCVEHPKKTLNYSVPKHLASLKALLREFVWLWSGNHPEPEQTEIRNALKSASLPEVALAFGLFVQRCIMGRVNEFYSKPCYKSLCKTVRQLICPDLLQLIDRLTFDSAVYTRTAEEEAWDREWADLLAEGEKCRLELEQAVEPVSPEQSPADPVAALPSPRPICLKYVTNFGSEQPQTVDRVLDIEQFDRDFAEFAQDLQLKPCIPMHSLSAAVYHYLFETAPEIKAVAPKEHVGSISWHKIKRGAMRIYVRETTDGVLLHAIHRKDWAKNHKVESRF